MKISILPISYSPRKRRGLSPIALSALLLLSGASAAPNPGGGVLFPIRESPELQAHMKRYHLKSGKYEQPHAISASAKADRERYAAVHGKPFPSHLRYLLFKPESDAGRHVPLLVYFPGSGEVGDDLMRQFRHTGIFSIVTSSDFQSRHPCYLLAISLPTGTRTLIDGLPGRPSAMQELVMGAVRMVAAASSGPAVDMNRLYVTGFSFGGECTYGLALSYPGVFAAAMPVASFPPPPQYISPHHPGAWWHIYNAGDYSVHGITPAMLTPFVQRVESLGGEFRTGTYPRDGHNAWSAAWQEQAAWNWLFSKTLDGSKVDDETQTTSPTLSGPKPVGKSEADKLKRVVSKDLKGAKCTASVPGKAADAMPELAVDGLDGTAYVSAKPVKKGDWFKVEFPSVVSGTVMVKTGFGKGGQKIGTLRKGAVEVSFDGQMWKRRGKFSEKTGECELKLKTDVIKFIRILPDPDKPQVLVIREITVVP